MVTSPPYYGLRDYGTPGQIGLETTMQEYIETMVAVFREVRRVLRPSGTAWLNLGDSFATGAGRLGQHPGGGDQGDRWVGRGVHIAAHASEEGRAAVLCDLTYQELAVERTRHAQPPLKELEG